MRSPDAPDMLRSLFSGAKLPGAEAEAVSSSFMPGLQAFGSARQVAALLGAVSQGHVLEQDLLQEMIRSRRSGNPGEDIEELAAELQHLLNLEDFRDFGLGVQLVHLENKGAEANLPTLDSFINSASTPAWGHLSQVGSMALLLPGDPPLAVVLLLNLSSRNRCGQEVASEILQSVQASRKR
ncbi:hypothetical protein AK812_SmicGene12203 [Symbiodinium microadriaticum]|uniref:Uncharacterized protein n=1 Tax=Symbiodinium microadriaticum TaxID=2951 RepID=A0A1Q9EB79_SYMMI|nr:hypothetical protein AK812_SmicGene12203 [Symbiodinium microadriaticum]